MSMTDIELLTLLIADTDLPEYERSAFADMRVQITDTVGEPDARLSKKQRAWAEEAARRVVPLRAEDVPRGKEVETPEVLRNLPTKPPGRS